MSIGEALKRELVTSTVTAAYVAGVGGAPDRVYPLVIPQKKPGGAAQVPAVVYSVSATERQKLYCGTDGTVRTRLSLDSYATTYEEARALADAVRGVLEDFRGLLGGTLEVQDATLETEIDLMDIEPGLYRVSQSWAVWHTDD
jgi:hypothetical protein